MVTRMHSCRSCLARNQRVTGALEPIQVVKFTMAMTPPRPANQGEFTYIIPGSGVMKMVVTKDGQIVIEGDNFMTEPHGFLFMWPLNPDNLTLCSSTKTVRSFRHNSVENFFKIALGVYISPDGSVLLEEEHVNRQILMTDFAMHGRHLPVEVNPPGIDVKHVFLWLHPKRDVQLVYVLRGSMQCVWRAVKFDGGMFSDITGVPNGVFSYDTIQDKPYFIFHWRGEEEAAKPVRMKPLVTCPGWYRAEGDGETVLDPDALQTLKSWHILAYKLQ